MVLSGRGKDNDHGTLYNPIASDKRVTFWPRPCACVFATLYACAFM